MIAECLSKGLKPKEISIQLKNEFKEINPRNIALLAQTMAYGKSWLKIRNNYDMSNCYCINQLNSKCPFTDEQIHKACKFMQDMHITDIPYRRILNIMDFYYGDIINDKSKLAKLSAYISLIKKKEIKKDICNQYNY